MLRTAALIALIAAGAANPRPREVAPSDWPLDRFLRNLQTRLATYPDDAAAHYTLGRVHAFAFALERSSLLGGGDENYIWVKDLADQKARQPGEPSPTPDERLTHLAEGVRHLRRACALEDSAMHRLTLAWLLETGAPQAGSVDTTALFELEVPASPAEREEVERWLGALAAGGPEAEDARRELHEPARLTRAAALFGQGKPSPDPHHREAVEALLQRFWLEQAIAAYHHCLERAVQEELFEGSGPLARIPREALEAYRRLVRARGVQGPEEERRLAEADARWKELEERPQGSWITPLLFTLDRCATLEELIAPELRVPFDLDGDGIDELWPWLAPGAGWLVWDPERRGEITSGRQLFGSASGWLFFEDGYRVLDALDDDRDGTLRGAELAGIAVWFDRDPDGVSDRGEVVPVEELGIVALASEATEPLGLSLGNPCGLELVDGRVLPTYDWVLAPPADP